MEKGTLAGVVAGVVAGVGAIAVSRKIQLKDCKWINRQVCDVQEDLHSYIFRVETSAREKIDELRVEMEELRDELKHQAS